MIDKQQRGTSPSAPTAPLRRRDVLKASWAQSRGFVSDLRPVTGTPRQILLGALLGVCVVFVVSFVGVSHLDTPLLISLFAFVVAFVLLGLGLALSYMEIPSGISKRRDLDAKAADYAIEKVCESGGIITVVVGVTAFVWHLNGWAVVVGCATLVVAFIAIVMLLGTYELRHEADLADPPADVAPQPDGASRQDSPL